MRLSIIAFLIGILLLAALPELPDRRWALALPGVALIAWRIRESRLPAWSAAGFLWALLLAPSVAVLPPELEGMELPVEGWIATIPDRAGRSIRFVLAVAAVVGDEQRSTLLAGHRLRLSWWDDGEGETSVEVNSAANPILRVGDRWQFTVRLKKPWGLRNPGGFDYERWLYAQGIIATGSIRSHPPPRRLAEAERYPMNRYRQWIAHRFRQALPGNPYIGILTALAVGERSDIGSWQWETFRRTGTSHLMAISGTHVGLIASLTFALIWSLWSRIPAWTLYWPATRAAALGALIGAGGYTLLSGLAVPAQRSFFMAAVAMLALIALRPAAPGRILALALLVVLIVDPGAPTGGGFWLSFGAVAIILYSVSGRWHEHHPFSQTVRLQLHITLGLLPPTLFFFQQFPLISPVANLIAIPWVGLTVLPLSLLAALLTPVSATLQALTLDLAAMTMEGLWQILCGLDQWPGLVLHRPTPPVWTLALALTGVAWLLAPRGLPGRWLGIPLCLPLLWPPMPAPVTGGFWFTLLDVGEGLSAVVRTRNHVLVYDTGRRLGFTLDAGRAALAPFLRWQGAERVDLLIVSHADSQHMSGVRSLRELLPVARILTSAPEQTPIDGAEACRTGQAWEWDAVRFQMLHPPPNGFADDNASCVLKVEGIAGRVLLPGDIETRAEVALAKSYGSRLAAEVLVAPHQGRRNLSTPAFLEAVHPRYILFATGYPNRYGYPRAETVARYQTTGATLLDSSYEGALTFRLEPGQPLVPERERSKNRRYWDAP
ncbi:MAG TPA: DNA internalization-related competence protein ComEC/Rec2 [Candidatus Competibacteraceae bacterium]|nr:DNA internalization-related competence protein ComEC/Rec2 [Candidatus Competibacteraceae bacterium]